MTASNPKELFTPFLATSIYVEADPDKIKDFLVDIIPNFADTINDKHIGLYLQTAEVQNGNKFFYGTTQLTRNGYQALAYIPSLPNAGVLVLTAESDPRYPLENVNPELVITNMWGTASKGCTATGAGDGDYFTFMNDGNPKITFTMSDTTLTITTTVDLSSYVGLIVIEYVRNGL